jgi:hypothetical protein
VGDCPNHAVDWIERGLSRFLLLGYELRTEAALLVICAVHRKIAFEAINES